MEPFSITIQEFAEKLIKGCSAGRNNGMYTPAPKHFEPVSQTALRPGDFQQTLRCMYAAARVAFVAVFKGDQWEGGSTGLR